MPPPPTPLPDELVEEVLFRLPPHEPAELVRAALVCRRWRRLVSDPGFLRRFREFHRRPPVLGMISNRSPRFVPTTAFCSRQANRGYLRALDARHGRALLGSRSIVVVWDPITHEERELPLPQWQSVVRGGAVLCSAAAGACDHLDCHHGPFLVIYVCSRIQGGETLVYTYSSDAAAWGDPVCAQQHGYQVDFRMGSALVGNTLYFGSLSGGTALKYNLELRQMSWIQLPSQSKSWLSVLTTTEDGALGLVAEDDSKLYMWSRKDTHELDAIWERRVIIELDTVFPVDVVLTTVYVIGSADGLGIVFMWVDKAVYTIDLKTYKVNKVYEGITDLVFPYMSFYTPAELLLAVQDYDCPAADDWTFATNVCEKLGIFYELTELFSGTKYVTANLFFPKVCEIKLKLNSWGHDENETIRNMSAAMIEKYDKYWADIHGLMAVAVILDPRLKMTMLHACYIALFGEDAAGSYVSEAHELLTALMKHYNVNQDSVATSSGGAPSTVSAAAVLSIFKTLAANKKTTSFVRSKNELDRYLEEETLPHDESDYFDILGWWKLEGARYPTLRLIARDILAIPITTVASESAFSTSGRVLSEHRSRLTPKMLEALMCSQSWLRHNLKDEGDGRFNSFWSCLEDNEEDLKDESCITRADSD